jgi:hypothetical protein
VLPLLRDKLISRPPGLQGIAIPLKDQAWRVPHGGVDLEVDQAAMSRFEADMLIKWIGDELRRIQENAKIGERDEGLRIWLLQQMQDFKME